MPSTWNIIKSVIDQPSIFKSKEKLYPEYVPSYLPRREDELKKLASFFKTLVLEPGQISQRVLITGGVGVGKTATAKRFGTDIKILARQRGVNLEYVHVNCHRGRSLSYVLQEVSRQLHIPIPPRGLSSNEMYELILKYLEKNNIYLLLTLDEFDYFVEAAGNDAVYFLIRTYDAQPDATKRISFIFITRSLTTISRLDAATESYLLKNTIKFNPYSYDDLYEILKYRVDEAFYPDTIDDGVIEYIARQEGADTGGSGNARLALEILLLAGAAAENEGSPKVTIEHVRRAISETSPNISILVSDVIRYLPLHELLVLLAIVRTLRRIKEPYVRMGEVEVEYRELCSMYGETPRKHTQVYEYVKDLKNRGIIEAYVSRKGYRGKSTLVGVSVGPLDDLEKYILSIVEKVKEK